MTLAEPTVLRSHTTADFLASVPGICGFTARNSVVLMPFTGKRTGGAMRVDLPGATNRAAFRAVATTFLELLQKMPHVDRFALVVYTDDTFAERRGIPFLELWREVQLKLRRAGFRTMEAACVASDGWASYLDPRRSAGGRPLREIAKSPLALEVAFHADRIVDIASLETLPDADSRLARRVAAAEMDLGYFGVRVDSFGIEHDADPDPIGVAERMLAVPAAKLGAQLLAEIVAVAHVPRLRDALLLTLACGRELGEKTLRMNEKYERVRAKTGRSFDEQSRRQLAKRAPGDDDLVLLGRSRRRPDAERLNAAIDALRIAAAHAPRPHRAGVLCVLTWMLWARGSQNAASRMLELAAECNPQLSMVETLGWLVGSGLPQWAFAEHRSLR